jgi:lipopolysaccharide transport protein LptA
VRRLRFFRILLPAVLLLFVVALALSLRERPAPQRPPPAPPEENGRAATGVRAVRLSGTEQTLEFEAGVVEPRPDGGFHLEQIERLGIARKGKPPLVVQARGAEIEGSADGRRIVAQDEVVVTDPEAGLVLHLPRLEVDEGDGLATSEGEIVFEGAGARGRASGLIYGLSGQPSRLKQPVLEHDTGSVVRGQEMLFLDGLHDVELSGAVEADRGDERFRAGRLRMKRDEQDRLRWAEAAGAVTARVLTPPAVPADLAAERLEAQWDEQRALERFSLEDHASISRAGQSLSAERIEGRRGAGDALWGLTATGTVFAQTVFGGGPTWIRSESLAATLGAALELRAARAEGHVRFESPDARAEADRAEFDPASGPGEIRLFGAENRKARMARGRTRVAAERIRTNVLGSALAARGRVEATLMPGEGAAPAPGVDGLFRTEQAIHFVSDALDGEGAGERLVFRDGVRAWQGERNLSADTVELVGASRTLAARGNVTTRVPRDAVRGAQSETDFVQVAAERLDYDGARRLATYSDDVRLTLLEGWLEAHELELVLAETGGIESIVARGDVRIEFSDPGSTGTPQLVAGTADRVRFDPAEQTVRLFGDERPATVRRLGPRGGTTSGRVLRYRLDTGTLEVESGEQAPARIRGR